MLASLGVLGFFVLGSFAHPLIPLQFTRYFVSLCHSLNALLAYPHDVDRSRSDDSEPFLRSEPCHCASIRKGECQGVVATSETDHIYAGLPPRTTDVSGALLLLAEKVLLT